MSFECYIGIIATLIGTCAVFVTISPLSRCMQKREFEKMKKQIDDRLGEIDKYGEKISTLEEETSSVRSAYRKNKEALQRAFDEISKGDK